MVEHDETGCVRRVWEARWLTVKLLKAEVGTSCKVPAYRRIKLSSAK